MSIPTVPEYRDPLHVLLEYIAEEALPSTNCDMVLVHDDDLARLHDSSSLHGLRPDEVLNHVRNFKPTVHNARIDLSFVRNNASADTESAWVATLSDIFETRSPLPTSSAPRSLRVETPLLRDRSRRRASNEWPLYTASITLRPEPFLGSEGCSLPFRCSSFVPPTYPTSGHAERPQVFRPVQPQLRPGLVNRHTRSAVFSQARAPDSAHPPYLPESLERLDAPQLTLAPRYFGLPAPSYRLVPRSAPSQKRIVSALSEYVSNNSTYSAKQPGPPQPLLHIPPHQFRVPVPPTYSIGGHASAISSPRLLGPVAPQLGMGPSRLPSQIIPHPWPSSASPLPLSPPLLRTPQPPYDVHQAHRLHALDSIHPYHSPRIGIKKALLIGINYSTHPDSKFRLKSSVRDAQEMAHFLQQRFGFEGNNIRVLTDEQPENLPTRENIIAAIHSLVEGAQSGDSLFFYFSGHATQIKDTHEDEPDGLDECMCAMDYMGDPQSPSSPTTPGIIVDDDVHDIMVKPLPRGCRLTAVLDCCHSGTLLDLPLNYDSRGVPKPRNMNANVHQRSSDANVISLSACADRGNPFDSEAHECRGLGRALMNYMTSWGDRGTYLDIMQNICTGTKDLRRRLQFSSSRPIDINEQFHRLRPWTIG
ncbi:caspase domain-containing protein, partial [Lactarius hengduanensis]